MNDKNNRSEDVTIALVEETAEFGIRERVTGHTRIATRTETVTENVTASVKSGHVTVTRVPVGRDLDPGEPAPEPCEEGDTTILPVIEEYLFVEKRLRLVEEVHIRRTIEVEDVNVPVTLRRQVADIEHDDVEIQNTPPAA